MRRRCRFSLLTTGNGKWSSYKAWRDVEEDKSDVKQSQTSRDSVFVFILRTMHFILCYGVVSLVLEIGAALLNRNRLPRKVKHSTNLIRPLQIDYLTLYACEPHQRYHLLPSFPILLSRFMMDIGRACLHRAVKHLEGVRGMTWSGYQVATFILCCLYQIAPAW